MIYLIIIVAIFAIDVYTKYRISKKYFIEEQKEIIKDRLYLWHKKNTGFSFSLLSGRKKIVSYSAFIITFGAIIYFIKLLYKNGSRSLKLGFSFMLGGALGNLYERIFKNGVTDFIYIKFKKAPIFNVADIFILIGNFIILTVSFFKKRI